MRTTFGAHVFLIALTASVAACGDSADDASAARVEIDDAGAAADAADTTLETFAPTSTSLLDEPVPEPQPLDTAGWLLAPPFYAAGDEPYWRLDAAEGWFVFQRLGLAEIDALILEPETEDPSQVFRVDPLTITVTRGACALASAAAQSEFTATVEFEDVEYVGCAFSGPPPVETNEAAGGVWVDALPAALAPIDACIAAYDQRGSGEAAAITAIYPREGELTAIVFQSATGRLSECGAPQSGGDAVFLDPIEPADAEDWMRGPRRFVRADNTPPPETCLEAEPAFDGDDQLIGYFLDADCRL